MIDKMSFFEHLSELEEGLVATLTQVSDIKTNYQKLLTENTSLRLENARLRDRLAEFSEPHSLENKNEKSAKKVPRLICKKSMKMGFMFVGISMVSVWIQVRLACIARRFYTDDEFSAKL